MKRMIILALSLLLMISVFPCAVSSYADSNILMVGPTLGTYDTITDALAEAINGDTIRLVEDYSNECNISITKSVTIDTYGHTWTGGTDSGTNKKQATAVIGSNANVVITNSQRVGAVTGTETTFDLIGFGQNNQNGNQGGNFKLTGTASLTMTNIVAENTNAYSGNRSSVVSFDSANCSATFTNCYLYSTHSSAIIIDSSYAANIIATNSIFTGSISGVMFINKDSDTASSSLSFEDCTVGDFAATDTGNNSSNNTSTDTFENVTINLTNTTTGAIYPTNCKVVYSGSSFSTSVAATITVDATEGTSLYSDAQYQNTMDIGVTLTEAMAVYSKEADRAFSITIDGTKIDTISSGANFELPSSSAAGFIAYCDGIDYYDEGQSIVVDHNYILNTVALGDFTMSSGAAMRLLEKSGIRYYTNVDTNKVAELTALGAKITMGTLIAPENNLNGSDLTLDFDSTKCANIEYWIGPENGQWFESNGFKGMVGSIVNIKHTDTNTTGNENRRFVGRGYFTISIGNITKTLYANYYNNSVSNNTRTVSYIATALKNDTTAYNALTDTSVVDYFAQMYDAAKEF